jgi:hypothetical protein
MANILEDGCFSILGIVGPFRLFSEKFSPTIKPKLIYLWKLLATGLVSNQNTIL